MFVYTSPSYHRYLEPGWNYSSLSLDNAVSPISHPNICFLLFFFFAPFLEVEMSLFTLMTLYTRIVL